MDVVTVLDLHIPDKQSLHLLYMPFLTHGGLFVPTSQTCAIGDKYFLILSLPEQSQPIAVLARAVWLMASHAQVHRRSGIGLQFLEEDGRLQTCIEQLLAGEVANASFTLTL